MERGLRTKDEVALAEFEKKLEASRKMAKEKEQEGVVIYVDFKNKRKLK